MRRNHPYSMLVLAPLLLSSGIGTADAQQYTASSGISGSFSDVDASPVPPAHVDGDTSPGSVWIRYDVTTGRGVIDTWHELYSCCVSNANGSSIFPA